METQISLIVPIYKTEKELPACIESILNQTYTNYELILLEDGSPDSCGQICEKYASKDSRIRVIHKENTGVADTRNIGIQLARGEYIGFVDSDDTIEPTMLEQWNQVIKKEQPDLLICDYKTNNIKQIEIRKTIKEGILTKKSFFENLYKEEYYGGFLWNKLFHKKLFQLKEETPILLNPQLKIMEDLIVVSKLAQKAEKIYYINQKLYNYRDREQSALHSTFQLPIKENIYQAYLELIPIIEVNSKENLEMAKINQCRECAHLLSLIRCTKHNQKNKMLEENARKIIKQNMDIVKRSRKMALKEKLKILLYVRFPYICGMLKTKGKESYE